MKVIKKDNFDRETVSDELICENVTNYNANMIASALNEVYSSDGSSDFFAVKEDSYILHAYDPS